MSETPRIALISLFVTAWVTGQVLAVKVLGLVLPFGLPLIGDAVIVPAGVLAIALTFLATDCLAELYGRRTAQLVVNIGFVMTLLMLALIWIALALPSAWSLGLEAGADPADFTAVVGFTPNIILGALVGYVVSQNWDVIAFDSIRRMTGGEHLWLRNIGSTATSQFLDTVIFIVVAYLLAPLLMGIGEVTSLGVIGQLIAGHYVIKFLIALADTPFVYLVVGYVREIDPSTRTGTILD